MTRHSASTLMTFMSKETHRSQVDFRVLYKQETYKVRVAQHCDDEMVIQAMEAPSLG